MNHKFETTVIVNDLELDVTGELTISVSNDGIGAYEFWGAKGIDRGQNSGEIDTLYIDSIVEFQTGFAFAESKQIREAVMDAIEKKMDKFVDAEEDAADFDGEQ